MRVCGVGTGVEILVMRVACSGYRIPDGTGKRTPAELPTGTTGVRRDEDPPLEPTERHVPTESFCNHGRRVETWRRAVSIVREFSLNLTTGSGHDRLLS